MKIATIKCLSHGARCAFWLALGSRMTEAGYSDEQIMDFVRPYHTELEFTISGTEHADRACDVAGTVRGVSYEISEVK